MCPHVHMCNYKKTSGQCIEYTSQSIASDGSMWNPGIGHTTSSYMCFA